VKASGLFFVYTGVFFGGARDLMTAAKKAVLLVNLGTPEQPTASGVRRFLKEFLSDRRVVEIPRLVWWPILHGFILPFRPKRVAQAYQSVWMAEGSPLRVITEQQCQALAQSLVQTSPENAPLVRYAMSYGKPSIAEQLKTLQSQGVEKIALIPLFPQYSATTTAAVTDQLAKWQLQQRDIADVRICKSYFQRRRYTQALADSVRQHWRNSGQAEKLLISFHGIPKRCIDLGDPYLQHCQATAENLAQALGLSSDQWSISFQSRLGRAEWLQPYTNELIAAWAGQGINSIDAICPAFSADCLETLEEIAVEAAQEFKAAGGESFSYIPCLNAGPDQVALLQEITQELLSF